MTSRADAAAEKRRKILAAAVHVFARQGFNAGRVSDIADQAGVAHGLVYHYFDSKDAILDELFSDRWALLLQASRQVDSLDLSARDKLAKVAGFIVDSYRYDPDLMKVIIVEVTRAANTFGQTHLAEISEAYSMIARIVAEGQTAGEFRDDISPDYGAMAFYGAVEQILTGWIFNLLPAGDEDFERATEFVVETVCGGLGMPSRGRPATAASD
ncbi:MAG: TetR/AcrR family transcriptional regulator [Solirubrobacterales bacterium]|nr:TetR/AcrR family transcriptional regulator [Solirubrobacterales bacterium]